MRNWLILLMLLSCSAQAVIETYQFDNAEQRVRYQHFIEELRCPKCQNQNLSGSDASIAADLRRELHRLLLEGRSDEQITEYMVNRYGDFILYRPRFTAETFLLWGAPAIFLMLGLVLIVFVVKRQKKMAAVDQSEVLLDIDQQRLQELLRDNNKEQS
jgi:cytochrome c-type biogenesis protein CcmH